ncbi:methanol dehydrogenase [Flavobacteriales bacterium 33_180_T64]|nr:methanol dehydrogenase [Flavobacteriales bacterium 33_180_T64]
MKHIISFVLISFISSIAFTANAQYDIPPKPEKLEDQKSVYDFIGLLSKKDSLNLEQKLIRYSDTTSTQIVVAIITTTKGENIGLLAPKWAHEWGIGQAKEDNGVFILLAKNDRKIWISPGYGVEDRLTAGINGELIRTIIIPEFKKGDYFKGLDNGTDAIFEILSGTYQSTRKSDDSSDIFPIIFFLFILLFFIILIIALFKNRRGGGNNGSGGNRTNGTSILDAIILSNMGRGSYGGSNSSSSGGSFGGGGFGGGFGGGGFSGGGAGGSW